MPTTPRLLPQDIKPEWLKVVRRLQSVQNQGYAVVTISILVNPEGKPIGWLSPRCAKIEPKAGSEEVQRLLQEIFGGDA